MQIHQLTVHDGEVTLDGRVIDVPPGANPHTVAVRAAKELAGAETTPGSSMHFEVHGAQGTFPLEITDGTVRAGALNPSQGGDETDRGVDGGDDAESTAGRGDTSTPDDRGSAKLDAPQRGDRADHGVADGLAQAGAPADRAARSQAGAEDDVVSSLRDAWVANAQARPIAAPLTRAGARATRSGARVADAPRVSKEPTQNPAPTPTPFEHTFIETHRAELPMQPKPVGGFAGVLAQFGIGGPSDAQRAEEADKVAVSKVWTRPKGIAVANGKGGSGKTPTSLYLAAMFARLGGGMVLVDDNNTFRGAAGWQTENAAHGATKEDLLAALPTFDGTERAADMARFTHHQTIDRYDVLQSRPQKLARDQALDDEDFDRIQAILRRFYRVVVFDSGNDESAPNWLRMIRHSDVLVVPTATTPKHCESAKLLLEALTASGGHGAELARKAVIVVSHASTNDPSPEEIAPRFAGMARHVLTIPHDPAIAREWLRWDDLAPKTQRAWLAVGAAVAGELDD